MYPGYVDTIARFWLLLLNYWLKRYELYVAALRELLQVTEDSFLKGYITTVFGYYSTILITQYLRWNKEQFHGYTF
jgi:hypothetical protein